MALINCPECGRSISQFANACPYCGCPAELLQSGDLLPILLKFLQSSNSSNNNNTNNASNNSSNFNPIALDDEPEDEPLDIPEPWTERDYRDYFGVPDDVPFDPDDYFDD